MSTVGLHSEDSFKFFVDNITLEKGGKDEKGNDVMEISGIATTRDKDSQDEEIDERGWDVSYFLSNGFFNYNHQSKFNPSAVIGEPTSAEITPRGVYVKGFLYPESKLARSVYDTAKMLQKSSSTRRMGFSIEGKVLERDPYNEKKILKATLTGCALTLNPRNPNTLVDILKGEYHQDDFVYDYMEGEEANHTVEKSEIDSTYIIHLERDGKTICIDRDLNIKITESPISVQVEKSLSASENSHITVESVDKELKNTEELPKIQKNLSKGEAYSEIFNYIYNNDLVKAEEVYEAAKLIATKRSKMNKNQEPEVTSDDIMKSLDAVIGKASTTLIKSEDLDDEGEGAPAPADNDEDEEEMELKKARDEAESKLQSYLSSKKSKKDIEKGEGSAPKADENAASMGKVGEFMSKSEVSDLVKGIMGGSFNETTDLIKSLGQATKGILEKNQILEKSLEDEIGRNNTLEKSIQDVLERVQKVENTPIPSRTVTSQNYMKHPTLEKSLDGNSKSLHAVQHKTQILDILDRKAALDSAEPNMLYAQSMAAFESSGALSKGVIDDLQKSEGIDIVGL